MPEYNPSNSKKPYDLAQFAAAHSPDRPRPSRGSRPGASVPSDRARPSAPRVDETVEFAPFSAGGAQRPSVQNFVRAGEYSRFPSKVYDDYQEAPEPRGGYEYEEYGDMPPQADHPFADTGEYPVYAEEDGQYQSVYPADDSGILREVHPDGTSSKPAPRPARRKKPDPRALLEHRISLVLCGVLALGLCAGTLLLTFLPRSTQSAIEKRDLAEFPKFSLASYFSGDFTAAVANYYTDTVPNRDGLKKLGSNIKSIFGISVSDVEVVGAIRKVPKEDVKPSTEPDPVPVPGGNADPALGPVENGLGVSLEGAAGRNMVMATPVPAVNPFHVADEADMTENGLIVVKAAGHYRGLELFGGGSGDRYVQALNDLKGKVGDGVQLWSMPAPLACEFYTPDTYRSYIESQSQCFDSVHAQLDPAIHTINICPVLESHVEENIYCRTDHHWQPLGAYYAAQAFAQAAGLEFDDISTYTPGTFSGFVGSMYSYTQSAKILNDPEDFTYYLPSREYQSVYYDTAFDFQWDEDNLFAEGVKEGSSDAYSFYLGGDQYIVKTDTPVQNGRKLLVMKDSFGNAEVPFYVGSFQQIYVADIRYMECNLVSFIRDMGITDVLFTMSAFSLVGDNGANIANLITQNEGQTIVDTQLY